MCGIAGVYSPENNNPERTQEALNKALEALYLRGPDNKGSLLFDDKSGGMGHTRLSILDLDERSNQPMQIKEEGLFLTYNGEIYNFKELKQELESHGESFSTTSDTEVILKGYKVWGLEKLLKKTSGMFAFGLYDQKQKRLFLARDRFGKKPLFYSNNNKTLNFASEIKALIELLPQKPSLNAKGLDLYLTLKFSTPSCHLLEGVHSVSPSHYMVFDQQNPQGREYRYWNLFEKISEQVADPAKAIGSIEAAIEKSIEKRLVSDAPLCSFLSGGIDSSLVAAIASQKVDIPLKSYCIGYKDHPEHSEFDHARRIADKYKLEYEEIDINEQKVQELLDSKVKELDEPISDWVWGPLYFLSQKARQDGYKVALIGEGADEVFFGYNSMLKSLKNLTRQRQTYQQALYHMGNKLLSPLMTLSHSGHKSFDLWRRVDEKEPLYMGTSFSFPKTLRPQLAGPKLLNEGKASIGYEYIQKLQSELNDLSSFKTDDVDLISYTEIFAKMTEVLLRRADRITMMNSLEARAPFLDEELAQQVFSVQGQSRIKGNIKKALLKEIARKYLPEENITRKKMGFSFPFKKWLYGKMGDEVKASFENGQIFKDGWLNQKFALDMLAQHRSQKRDNAPKLWQLYSLSKWYDHWC